MTSLPRPQLDSLTIAPFTLEFLLDGALRAGVDLSAALIPLGIEDYHFEDPQARIPMIVEEQLFRQALQASGDSLFGLHMGEGIRPRFIGELGYASMSSATLRDAIELMIPFTRVVSEFAQLKHHWEDNTLCLHWESDLEALPTYPARIESTFAAAIVFGRWLVGQSRHPEAVFFKHAAQGDHAEYHRIFGCPVHFDAPHNALLLDETLLSLPLRDADPEMHKLARMRIQRAVSHYRARDNLLEQVRLVIRTQLESGLPQLDPIADELGMKPWTLRRQLSAEGTDFSRLLEEERRKLACDWLLHSNRSVNQVALDLGYSEQSAFNRAFKRWFDETPLQFKERHKEA